MKRVFFILFLIGSMALPALSQTGLHIAQLFDGPFKRRTGATEVYMKGRSVKNYGPEHIPQPQRKLLARRPPAHGNARAP